MTFASVYPHYVTKVESKGRTKAELHQVIEWLTGFNNKKLQELIKEKVIEKVDHRNLNTDVPWLEGRIPTAENLALAFWERIRSELPDGLLRSVRLWETDKNWAEVGDHD